MRLFVAVPVTGAAAAELAALVGRYRALGWPVKWVGASHFQVTVKFLGEALPDAVAAIETALRGAVGSMAALPFHPDGLGGFPTTARARVLWAEYQTEPALELMADRVERACVALGFAVDGRPFRPHVTLGRVRDGHQLSSEAVAAWDAELLHEAFMVDQVVLYQSHLRAEGSRYDSLARFPMMSA